MARFFDPNGALDALIPVNVPRAPREAEFVADFLHQWYDPGTGDTALPWYNWGQPWVNTGQDFAVPVFVVPHDTPRVEVEYVDPWAATPGYPENGAYTPAQDGNKDNELAYRLAQGVPLPAELLNDAFYNYTVGATGKGDAGVAIVDEQTGELWEFWLFCTGRSSGKPCVGYAGWMPDHRQNPGYWSDIASPYQSKLWGSSATSISIAGAQISQQELIDGVIPHALGIDLMGAADWWDIVWPAQRGDGQNWSPIPEGTRFRLDPAFDVNSITSSTPEATRTARMIAKAGQDYGWVVWDKGGSIAFQVEPGDFDWTGGEFPNNMLKAIPLAADNLQVVDPAWRPGDVIVDQVLRGGFLRDRVTGALAVTTDTTGAVMQGGFLRSPDGRLVVAEAS